MLSWCFSHFNVHTQISAEGRFSLSSSGVGQKSGVAPLLPGDAGAAAGSLRFTLRLGRS